MTTDVMDASFISQEHSILIDMIKAEIGKAIVGQERLVNRLLVALLADGHILLEGLPGMAKTLAAHTVAKVTSCGFKRIQFTPDLLPADLLGTLIYNAKESSFSVKKGPIFTNIVLADEINRAPPKVQSALLEVMQERQVTIGNDTFLMETPFLVLATQNPIEQEGTYPLPEAQTDRFMMKVVLGYPSRDEERAIVARYVSKTHPPEVLTAVITAEDIRELRSAVDTVYVDNKIAEYILDIVFATRDPHTFSVPIEKLLDFGASPRATLAITQAAKAHAFLAGRGYVIPHDVKSVGRDVLRHRLRLSYEAEADGYTADSIIDTLFETLLVP